MAYIRHWQFALVAGFFSLMCSRSAFAMSAEVCQLVLQKVAVAMTLDRAIDEVLVRRDELTVVEATRVLGEMHRRFRPEQNESSAKLFNNIGLILTQPRNPEPDKVLAATYSVADVMAPLSSFGKFLKYANPKQGAADFDMALSFLVRADRDVARLPPLSSMGINVDQLPNFLDVLNSTAMAKAFDVTISHYRDNPIVSRQVGDALRALAGYQLHLGRRFVDDPKFSLNEIRGIEVVTSKQILEQSTPGTAPHLGIRSYVLKTSVLSSVRFWKDVGTQYSESLLRDHFSLGELVLLYDGFKMPKYFLLLESFRQVRTSLSVAIRGEMAKGSGKSQGLIEHYQRLATVVSEAESSLENLIQQLESSR